MKSTHRGPRGPLFAVLSSAIAVALSLQASVAHAQAPPPAPQGNSPTNAEAETAEAETTQTLDAIVVSGIRETQRTSVQVKRDEATIMDAIVSDEIGALPDNSVAETLERIPGVTADRFKGSASEVSVRGMGPFLGFSTLNGREVSSGGANRAVSFQQFPSELTNGVLVYKSQQADFVEGGISGVIELRTARPLDFDGRRLQFEGRANHIPYADKAGDDLGSRLSASYIDQFYTDAGSIGISIGFASTDSAAPEDFYTASSSFRPCNTINANPTAVTGGNCSFSATSGNPVYFVPNQFNYRQLDTEDTRRGLAGALQWQPSDRMDFNLDLQFSERKSFEDRHDLVLAEGRRGIQPLELSDEGALLRWAGNSYLESHSAERQRDETYAGGGLSASFRVTDALTFAGDLSYSRTHRTQLDFATRLRSNTLFGPNGRVAYTAEQTGTDIPIINFLNPIDLNNHAAFTGNAYARRQSEDRVDDIAAGRFDMTYARYGAWSQIKAGIRFSDHGRTTDLSNNNNRESIAAANALAGNANCRIDNIVDGWGRDSNTNISTWAQFDTRCLYRAFTGTDDLGPLADSRSSDDLDITERITAAYVMGTFSSDLGRFPVSGNLGVRLVDSRIRSSGFRGDFSLLTTNDPITGVPSYTLVPVPGTFEQITIRHDYQHVLPSFNITMEASEKFLVRGALYKAIARSNPEDLGAGRDLITDGNAATPEEALAGASGGNPRLEPLESWNADVSFEYYLNQDTNVALALFYKTLKAGAVPAEQNSLTETFVIDGISYTVPVAQQANSDDTSYIRGFEVSTNIAFSWLPQPFDGLGLQLAYSYADSNFEYPDPSAVDPANPLANFVAPVGLPGFSKHSGSATAYYERNKYSVRLGYKYRSEYSKPFGLTANRIVDDAGFLDLSMTYNFTRDVQLKFQAINLNEQNQVMYRPVGGSIGETSYFGTSYLLGLRVRIR